MKCYQMDTAEFLFDTTVDSSVVAAIYLNVIFKNVPGSTFYFSLSVLLGLIFLSIILGTFILYKNLLTHWTEALCTVTPFGLYTILSNTDEVRKLTLILFFIAFTLWLICAWLILTRKIKYGANQKQIQKRRWQRCFIFFQSFVGIALALVIAFVGAKKFFPVEILQSDVEAINTESTQDEYIEAHINELLIFQEEEWSAATTEAKLNALQIVANNEAIYFGLPHALNVVVAELEEDTLGTYNDSLHRISLDKEHIEEDYARAVLKTLLHECRHAYQHRLVDVLDGTDEKLKTLKIFTDISCFQEEFENYTSGSENYRAYEQQICEYDANSYEQAADYYFYKIENHLDYLEMIEDYISN